MDEKFARAQKLLQDMLGPDSQFRPGQWEAIEMVAFQRRRALVVQRTGWGKSLIYFLATRLLRDQGAGPTLLISPLLSLMRNQIEMAEKIGIQAFTINSANRKEWDEVERGLAKNSCDILLISPERLNNPHFVKSILPELAGKIGLFVVDEAHCISDWGHDFRPDYRRIVRILKMLPESVPVLGTTATANDRVINDIRSQLGGDLLVQRGTLIRETLRLQNLQVESQAERLAWFVENLSKFEGSGIIYCLTIADTERVTAWLKNNGFCAEAYHAGNETQIDRVSLEEAFLKNKIKILVATVALGMGFDKPDISFVIHFQRPGSVIAYYQQIGRAGRAVDRAYAILLSGAEDGEIQDYFIKSSFPDSNIMQQILEVLEKSESLSIFQILEKVNCSFSTAEKALKILEVDGAVSISDESPRHYFRTVNPWRPDTERIERVLALRRAEQAEMQTYVGYKGCLMEFLQRALDDSHPSACGRCANCRGKGLPDQVSQDLVSQAISFLRSVSLVVEPRKMWASGLFPDIKRTIPEELCNAPGRSLCYYGDSGWGTLVRSGKYVENAFSDELVEAAASLIKNLWKPDPFPQWLTAIPSNRHPTLVAQFCDRLAARLDLPYCQVLVRTGTPPEQKSMQNSTMQSRNVLGSLQISSQIYSTPVLLVDDIIDSGWTLTMAGYLLRNHGSGLVYPFTLAKATSRNP